jgi:hypothetical protein
VRLGDHVVTTPARKILSDDPREPLSDDEEIEPKMKQATITTTVVPTTSVPPRPAHLLHLDPDVAEEVPRRGHHS